jgi:DNA primase
LWKLKYGYQAATPTGRDFIDMVRSLCKLAGVPFPEREASPQAAERLRQLKAREAILADVYSYFRKFLLSPDGDSARAYLEQRGVSMDRQAELQLGLYPSIQAVREHLKDRGHPRADVQASGVVWDRMPGYITFPWHDRERPSSDPLRPLAWNPARRQGQDHRSSQSAKR